MREERGRVCCERRGMLRKEREERGRVAKGEGGERACRELLRKEREKTGRVCRGRSVAKGEGGKRACMSRAMQTDPKLPDADNTTTVTTTTTTTTTRIAAGRLGH